MRHISHNYVKVSGTYVINYRLVFKSQTEQQTEWQAVHFYNCMKMSVNFALSVNMSFFEFFPTRPFK